MAIRSRAPAQPTRAARTTRTLGLRLPTAQLFVDGDIRAWGGNLDLAFCRSPSRTARLCVAICRSRPGKLAPPGLHYRLSLMMAVRAALAQQFLLIQRLARQSRLQAR